MRFHRKTHVQVVIAKLTIQLLTVAVLTACGDAPANHDASDGGQDASPGFSDGRPSEPDAAIPRDCSYYSDPNNGSSFNDGSIESPWASLESILSSDQIFAPGDVICLLSGNHGAIVLVDRNYDQDIVFTGLPGESARISDVRIERSSGITLEAIEIDASERIDPNVDEKDRFIVRGDRESHHISFLQVSLKSAESIERWTKDDWYKKSKSGFDMRGSHITIRHCLIKNTYHAISLRGDYSELSHSIIDNFAGDGVRGHGSFSTYEFNVVRDAYVNDYAIQHDDLFQAFSLADDPKIEGVVIRNNRFIQFLDLIDSFVTNNDLVSHDLQGIIITDGYADTWLVENNLVVVDHFHGITLYGARHSRVQNNTVVQSADTQDVDVPWIRLTVQTKTGHQNFDNVIRNNLATHFTPLDYDITSLVENNMDIDQADQSDYRRYFQDYDSHRYQLKATSPAVNAGVNTQLSVVDLADNARLRGAFVDLGAFEFQK